MVNRQLEKLDLPILLQSWFLDKSFPLRYNLTPICQIRCYIKNIPTKKHCWLFLAETRSCRLQKEYFKEPIMLYFLILWQYSTLYDFHAWNLVAQRAYLSYPSFNFSLHILNDKYFHIKNVFYRRHKREN